MTTTNSDIDSLAECANAISHPHRLKLLEALRSESLSVDQLARQTGLTLANASRHLQILRRTSFVYAERRGKQIFYALQDPEGYAGVITALRAVTKKQNAVIRDLRVDYLTAREKLQPVSRDDLLEAIREDRVQIIDVRPASEYESGHIINAMNIPLGDLDSHLGELSAGQEIVAYCRGPHCILSFEAVAALQSHGFRARRLSGNPALWQESGLLKSADT